MNVAVTFENGRNVTNAEGDVSTIYQDIVNVEKNERLELKTEIGGIISFPRKFASVEATDV